MSGAEPRVTGGGDGVAGAPPLTRLATQHAGNHEPGFSKRMPGSAQDYRNIPAFSAESIVLLVGLPRALASGVWVLTKPSPQHPPCQG